MQINPKLLFLKATLLAIAFGFVVYGIIGLREQGLGGAAQEVLQVQDQSQGDADARRQRTAKLISDDTGVECDVDAQGNKDASCDKDQAKGQSH